MFFCRVSWVNCAVENSSDKHISWFSLSFLESFQFSLGKHPLSSYVGELPLQFFDLLDSFSYMGRPDDATVFQMERERNKVLLSRHDHWTPLKIFFKIPELLMRLTLRPQYACWRAYQCRDLLAGLTAVSDLPDVLRSGCFGSVNETDEHFPRFVKSSFVSHHQFTSVLLTWNSSGELAVVGKQ